MQQRRPVIVGVGQIVNKDDDRIISPLEGIEAAVRAAVEDSGQSALDHVGALYLAPPWMQGSDDAATELAERLGLRPGKRHVSVFSGSSSLELLGLACAEIRDGELDAAIIAGGVADASVLRARKRGLAPPSRMSADWTWDASTRKRTAETSAGLNSAGANFAMAESRLAFRAGRTPSEQREWLGTVMAPFTEVAAQWPDRAWFPISRESGAISGVSNGNRLVAEPYPKLMHSFPNVDQAAAILVMSSELADRLRVPDGQRVYPRSIAACQEPFYPSGRQELHAPGALAAAASRALEGAALEVGDISRFDLYSCFPAAVQMGAAALGLDVMDPRGLTVTGGLPYFGGPGAAYVAHSTATMVELCRADPGSIGAIGGVGGMVSRFAVGSISTDPGDLAFQFDPCTDVEQHLANEGVEVDLSAEGVAVVEAMTVLHDREAGPVAAPVFARFGDGRRTGARLLHPELASDLSNESLIGREVRIVLEDDGPRYDPR